jgi:hypothetical protein
MAHVPVALGVVLLGGIVLSFVLMLMGRDDGADEAGSPGGTAGPARSGAAAPPADRPAGSPSPSGSKKTGRSTSPRSSPRQFDFTGTWRGIVNQGDGASIYDVEITYTGGAQGERVAGVRYPTLGCGGYLTLQSRTPDRVKVLEHLTFGAGKCLDDTEISLTRLGADAARYYFVSSRHTVSSHYVGESQLARD